MLQHATCCNTCVQQSALATSPQIPKTVCSEQLATTFQTFLFSKRVSISYVFETVKQKPLPRAASHCAVAEATRQADKHLKDATSGQRER